MKQFSSAFYSLLLLASFLLWGCQPSDSQEVAGLPLATLESAFIQFREPAITHRRFKHADLQPLITKHQDAFEIVELGKSVEGRTISNLKWGAGKTKIMLWSQMHGNESTATMALFDLFNFLKASGDEYDSLRAKLKSELSLSFIPMLNPDGAEVFKRRNALDIDLNRDAISQISPEAIILKSARDTFEHEFGFNLHDQQVYYNVKGTPKQATISILAPAYNIETEINPVRERAMQTIVGMNEILQQLIPGQIGKYDDEFEPRAFGDNIQKWGTSTILIESGGYTSDPEKQYIRQLNFMIILNALHQIATQSYTQYTQDQYAAIPDNGIQLMDVILKEVQVEVGERYFPIDIAIRRRENEAIGGYFVAGSVEDLGDMQVFFGFEELDAKGMKLTEGKVYEKYFEKVEDISETQALELLKQGFIAVKVKNGESRTLHNLPILVLKTSETFSGGWMTGSTPNFFLSKGANLKYALVNGYLINLQNPSSQVFKQRIY